MTLVEDICDWTGHPDPTRTWLTVEQGVQRLAEVDVHVTAGAIRQWIHRGHLPSVKLGRQRYFTEQALMHAERDTRLRRQATRRDRAPI